MLEGKIVSLDPHRNTGEVAIDGTGWRVPAEIPRGLTIGDKVAFLIQSQELNPFQRGTPRAVDVRRA